MDDREYDSIELLNLCEVVEQYYQMLRSEMDTSVKETKTNSFDGRLHEDSFSSLTEFAENHQIIPFSRALAELLTALEWHNEKKVPQIQETAIYNALLRLEKVADQTSSWELCGKEFDGPVINISTFEMDMLEKNATTYVVDMLKENTSQTMFFPLSKLFESDVYPKWRVLAKLANLKGDPEYTTYKQRLKFELTNRIENEVETWLQNEFKKLKLSGKSTVLKDTENLIKILKELKIQVTMCIDVISADGFLFEATSCSYFDILSKAIHEKLYEVCLQLMKAMDTYQEFHKSFHVNLRDSCALSHRLYRQIKDLVCCLQIGNKTSGHMQFEDYSNIFIKFFMNLLQVMKLECHYRIKRAVNTEVNDAVHEEERILSSSVIVLSIVCTVIDEWKHMAIEDEELQIAFLIKITDIISDGAKIFAESLEFRLDNSEAKDFEYVKKVCIIANSVEHVKEYLQELPEKMQWEKYISISKDTPDSETKRQVLRILNLIHQSMDLHLQHTVQNMLEQASSSLVTLSKKLMASWLHNPCGNQAYERVQSHLIEHLKTLNEVIKEKKFPKFLSLLWSSILTVIQKQFLEGEPPEYAETLKKDIMHFNECFLYMEESESHKPVLDQIMSLIDLNSKSTVDLQLDYYSHVAESIVSPVEYLGHIAFQAGYKIIEEDVIDLYINVQKGQRLPARTFEMSELHVKLALCPPSMFQNHVPLKSRAVTENLDNPVFNELFQFSKLPSSVLSVKGAVVQVHVLNQDNTYSAEAVLLLKQVQNMSGFTSLEFLPVYLMALKKVDMSQIAFQVLENRSRWDKSAKHFISSRVKSGKGQKMLLSCIPGKNACFL